MHTQHPPRSPGIFQVPEERKYLQVPQMRALEEAFALWRQGGTGRFLQSRTRVWMLFLLVRYTGVRLGEALGVDDLADFDFTRAELSVAGKNARCVPLPKHLVYQFSRLLEEPVCASLRGRVLHLDQGYVRRKFSERALEAGLPQDLVNPRVLRHSRAVELLRAGVPAAVVDSMLGRRARGGGYVSFSKADSARILEYYVREEHPRRTSARNTFLGQVAKLKHGDVMTEVTIQTPGGVQVIAVITRESFESLGLCIGTTVSAVVKAPWVHVLCAQERPKADAQNVFPATVTAVRSGMVIAEISVELSDGSCMTSLMSESTVQDLDLQPGQQVYVLVKAFSVIVSLV